MVDDAPRILGGRYEVGELIGRGGMAEVHIGHDTRLGRTVAIKILRSDLARDPSFQARFRREAQAAASLNHPAIVAVYDTGEDVFTEHGGGVAHVPFIVMEYVEGHTVRDILRDGSAVPIEEAVEITAGVLSALEYSHHAGIVHRDIKPANVMLTPTGAVKVMDFGIARAMADSAGTMTQTQAVIGTAQYLSPEQARGEAVDSRSDLYSTGCLLFELLTGRPPFIGDSPVAVAYQHAREEAQAPSAFASDVPESLDRITMKALAKDRESRYSTAAEFRSDLEAAIRGGRVSAPAVGALGAAALGGAAAAAYDPGPATAATQVIGGMPNATQVAPAAAPWSQTGVGAGAGTGGYEPSRRDVPPEPEEEPSRRWILWALVAVALIAVAGIIFLLNRNGTQEPETTAVAVPDVVNMADAAARELIEDAGLVYTPVTEPSTEVAEGNVIRTDPEAEVEVEPGEEVTAYISSGPDAVVIPELKNFSEADARRELNDLGIEDISIQTEASPDVTKDAVTRTEPVAGTSVDPGQPVKVYLSTGQVDLIDLTGAAEADASAALVALRLTPIIKYEESETVAPGLVIRQSRSPGPVPQGSSVELTIATEPTIETVRVPVNLIGETCADAKDILGASNLNGVCQYADGKAAENTDVVTNSNPAPGAEVEVGSQVVLIVTKATPPGNGTGTTNP